MRSALYWELRKFQRAEWWYPLFFLPLFYLLFKFEFRRENVPFAVGTFEYFMNLAMASLFSIGVLFSNKYRPSDLPYVLSRPEEAGSVWPIRLAKIFAAVLLVAVAVPSSSVLNMYAHESQFNVHGCDALYRYERAGYAPVLNDERTRDAYSSFRAGEKHRLTSSAPCGYGVVEIPGFADRMVAITLLLVLILSAATMSLLAITRMALADRLRNVKFWLALVPASLGVLLYARIFVVIGSERHFSSDGPLIISQAAPWLIPLLALAATFYLVLAHRCWKRIEVLV